MRIERSRRTVLGDLVAVAGIATGLTTAWPRTARSASNVRVLLDRRPDGAAAPFFAAQTRGLFRTEGIDVTTDTANGSRDAIERVARGDADIAIADFNALIRYRDTSGAAALKAIFIVFNRTPYALVARKSRGVATLADMPGKTLGVAEGDLAIRLWPAVAKQNGIDLSQIKIERMAAAVRGPMLSAGQVDATTGLTYGTAVDLRDRGVPANDLMVFQFADYGCQCYGQAVIVSPQLLADHPDAAAAFVRALAAGIRFAAKDPARAVDAALAQMDGGARDVELERLRTVLADNIVTAEVKRNGLGAIDPVRFDTSVQQIAVDTKFRKTPVLADLFDPSFLPPAANRKII
jgi:NitT/TauT family transport system substrate-binding protein